MSSLLRASEAVIVAWASRVSTWITRLVMPGRDAVLRACAQLGMRRMAFHRTSTWERKDVSMATTSGHLFLTTLHHFRATRDRGAARVACAQHTCGFIQYDGRLAEDD
jgi:hypothetical protein